MPFNDPLCWKGIHESFESHTLELNHVWLIEIVKFRVCLSRHFLTTRPLRF